MKPTSKRPKADAISRRSFLARASTSIAVVTIVPGYVIATRGQTPPSGKLNIAAVGVGGMGRNNIRKLAGENIVALCDVDFGERATKIFKEFPKEFVSYCTLSVRSKTAPALAATAGAV